MDSSAKYIFIISTLNFFIFCLDNGYHFSVSCANSLNWLGRLGKLRRFWKKAPKSVRVRHHTSPRGLKGIKNDAAINPARGEPIGVHVEVETFGPAKTASAETGAFGKGAYVEFDAPANMVKTNVGPRNTAVIPSDKPLSIKDLRLC